MPIPNTKKAEPPRTAKERIYQTLREWIVDGTLAPGEKLNDLEISRYFQVSRTPVREAMQLLADQRLVEIFPGRESRVTLIERKDVTEIYEMLAELHCMAVRFSYASLDEPALQTLEEINRRFAKACEKADPLQMRKFDREFHGFFIDRTDNAFLRRFLETLGCHVERIENKYYTADDVQVTSHLQHQAIIAALRQKDLDKALKLVRENWIDTLKCLA